LGAVQWTMYIDGLALISQRVKFCDSSFSGFVWEWDMFQKWVMGSTP